MAGTIKGITVEINGDATKLTKALQDINRNCSDLDTNLKQVNKALQLDPSNTVLLTEKQEILADAVQAAKEKVEALESVQDQVTAQYEAGEIDRGAYLDFQNELEKARQKLEYLEDQQEQFANTAKKTMQEVGEEIQEYGDKLQNIGDSISNVGSNLTKSVTTPIVAVGTAAVAAFNAVDEGYDIITKATGAAGDAAEELQQIYKDISSEMPVEMEDVATAIGEINTRFQTTGDTLKSQTELFLEFAEVTDGDVQTAVANADKIMESWGLNMEALPDLLGMITAKAQETGISADTLMQSVQSNGATFKELDFTLEESINFMAQMEANGVEASTALAGLKKATNELTDAGMDESDALAAVIDSIKNAATETEALQIAQETFGTKGAAEMATAIREGRIDLDDLADSMENYGTTVQDTYANTVDGTDSLTTAGNAAKIALSEVGSVLSDMMAPVLQNVATYLKEAADKFASLDEKTQKTIITVALVVAAIGPVITIIGGLVSTIGTAISAVGTIVSGIGSLISVVSGAASGVGLLSTAIGFLTSPVGIAVAAAVALGAILVTLYNNCEGFRNAVNKLAEILSGALSTAVNAIGGFFVSAWDKIKGAWGTATSWFSDIVSSISTTFGNVLGIMSSPFTAARDFIKEQIDKIRSFFNFTWSLPSLKLPHISISGSFSLSPLSVPHFSISWYKAGGILDGATIFGALGNNLLGGGEAGQEAVLPLDSFYSKLESILGSQRMSGISVNVNIDRFDNYGDQDIDKLSETVADRIYWAVQRKEAALT